MLYREGLGLIIGRRASIKSNWRFAVALGGWPFVSSSGSTIRCFHSSSSACMKIEKSIVNEVISSVISSPTEIFLFSFCEE